MATAAAMTPAAGLMTAEEFCEWASRPENDGKRLELERGKVIEMPSPGRLHGTICFLVTRILGNYLFARGTGSLCSNDTGLLVERAPDSLRGPDVMLFMESRPLDQISRSFAEEVPQLVVEVRSPSDRNKAVARRIEQYLRRGVPLVWLVEPDDRIVTVYRPNEIHRVLDDADELTGDGVLPDFRCRVADLFTLPGQQ
jgi:Uma2 family endonuclease